MSQSSYKDLIAWQKGMELVAMIYDATEGFPSKEQFGLVSQSVASCCGLGSEQYRRGKGPLLQPRFRSIPSPRPRLSRRD